MRSEPTESEPRVDASKKRKRRKGVLYYVLLLVSLALLYVLSTGPAMLVYVHFLPRSAFEPINKFYSPLLIAAQRKPKFNSAMTWYVSLWVDQKEIANKR